MQISDIMNDDLVCITADGTVREAAQLMEKVDCGILPVVKDEASRRPIGVLTDRDIVLRCVAEGGDATLVRVDSIASRDLVTCDEDCTVAEAFQHMRTEGVGRLLVTDSQGDLIGIVTMKDIIARVPREVFDQLPGAEQSRPRLHTAA